MSTQENNPPEDGGAQENSPNPYGAEANDPGAENDVAEGESSPQKPSRFNRFFALGAIVLVVGCIVIYVVTGSYDDDDGGRRAPGVTLESDESVGAQDEERTASSSNTGRTPPGLNERQSELTAPGGDVGAALRAGNANDNFQRGQRVSEETGQEGDWQRVDEDPRYRPGTASYRRAQAERQAQNAGRRQNTQPSPREQLAARRAEALAAALGSSVRGSATSAAPSGPPSAPGANATGPYASSQGATQQDTLSPRERRQREIQERQLALMESAQRQIDTPRSAQGQPLPPGTSQGRQQSSSGSGEQGSDLSRSERSLASQASYLEERRSEGQQRQQEDLATIEVQGPLQQFTIAKGTIIPIAVESKVSSELPGYIIMRVTQDVRDRSKEHILIPAGSEVFADYNNPSAVGQKRLLIAANRLTMPDGRIVNFSATRATGPLGQAGLEDQIDRHLLSRFGAVGGLAVLGAVTSAAAAPGGFSSGILGINDGDDDGGGGGTAVIYPGRGGVRQNVETEFANQINQVIGQMLEQQIGRQPTLTLRPGLRGQLIIGSDINFGRPYYANGSDLERVGRENRFYEQRNRIRQERLDDIRDTQREILDERYREVSRSGDR